MTWAKKVLDYHFNLQTELKLPHGVQWLFPYSDSETKRCMGEFYNKYYNDNSNRGLMLGINPGRFGAGLTGIPFTDPIRLDTKCGINNSFLKKQELSSLFVYDVIEAYGGCRQFYKHLYISALSPLGFIRDNKNYNYYDNPALLRVVEPFIISHLKIQIDFGCKTDRVYCLGQGKNFQYLEKLNNKHQFFNEIIPLPHPRWVMQYRLKKKREYVRMYIDTLRNL